MSENLPTGPDKEEGGKRLESAIHASLDAIAKRHEDRVLDGVADLISKYEMPDRSGVPEFTNRKGDTVHRLSSPTSALYKRLPDEVKAIRNPDSDHWMAQFVLGVMTNDGATKVQARAKLSELFPDHARNDTLAGAADASGGFAAGTGAELLPRPLENLVAIARDAIAKMSRWATTYNMTAQEHNIPTGTAVTAFMQAEATSPSTQGEPTYAQVPLVAHKMVAKLIMGNDIMEDAAFNIVNFVSQRGGAALGALEDVQFFTGSGTPPNVTGLSGTAYAETTTNALGYSDVIAMFRNLGQVYRGNARWLVAADVLGYMANVRLDTISAPFYQSLLDPPMVLTDDADGSPFAGAQGTLLGRPVHEVPLASGDIWFGDPRACYAIGRRQGLRVEMSRDFYFDTFRTIMLIHQRIAGNNVDTAAAQYAQGISSATTN